uniref:Uncharacterized protein n=1 Tax=Bionectria ochroleuca TaxID=29856 RepID=A0A0B7K5W6_BIOOC
MAPHVTWRVTPMHRSFSISLVWLEKKSAELVPHQKFRFAEQERDTYYDNSHAAASWLLACLHMLGLIEPGLHVAPLWGWAPQAFIMIPPLAVIPPPLLQQLTVRAPLDDGPLVHDEDLVGGDDGRQPVGDDEHGAALAQLPQRRLDEGLGLGVDGAGGLVEDEDGRALEEGAGDGDALDLAARQLDAVLADGGAVALGEGVEEQGVLGHDADGVAEGALGDVADVAAVDPDAAGGDVVVAQEELGEGGLACARGADEGDCLAGLGVDVDAVEDGSPGVVAEADVVEGDVTRDFTQLGGARLVDDGDGHQGLDHAGDVGVGDAPAPVGRQVAVHGGAEAEPLVAEHVEGRDGLPPLDGLVLDPGLLPFRPGQCAAVLDVPGEGDDLEGDEAVEGGDHAEHGGRAELGVEDDEGNGHVDEGGADVEGGALEDVVEGLALLDGLHDLGRVPVGVEVEGLAHDVVEGSVGYPSVGELLDGDLGEVGN